MMPFYPGPRSIAELNADTLAGVGWAEPTRDGAELRTLEHFEFNGLLPKKLKSQPNEIVFTCYDCFKKCNKKKKKKKKRTADPNSASQCLRTRWRLDMRTGEWLCTHKNSKCCNVEQVRTGGAKGPKTSAYQAKHVAPLLVQYVSEAGKLPPSVATPHLGAVCARPLALTFAKNVCNLA